MIYEIVQQLIHYGLHFIAPVVIAWVFFRSRWKQVTIILLLTMLVDIDHLFADPIFDPQRCSIGFHFLHSHVAILIYTIMLFFKKTRIVGIGLVLHMITDFQDCLW